MSSEEVRHEKAKILKVYLKQQTGELETIRESMLWRIDEAKNKNDKEYETALQNELIKGLSEKMASIRRVIKIWTLWDYQEDKEQEETPQND